MGAFFEQYGMMLFWLGVTLTALIVEVNTADMVSIWFCPGAVAAMILSVWVKPFWIQLVLFAVLSAAFLTAMRLYFRKHPFRGKAEAMNADSLIGTCGVVLEPIDNLQETGSVKLGALVWTARSADEAVSIPEGTVVVVREIVGVKAICSPAEQGSGNA